MEKLKSLIQINRKKEINLLFAVLCIYTIFIIINDYICFCFQTNSSLLTYAISAFLVGIVAFFITRKVKIKPEQFSKYDLLFFVTILGIYAIKFAIPDKAFDTLNYHLYVQENTFSDNIMYHFFPARWINTFSFPLGDRMHYFFRFFLGYRLGNIFNVFILIVVYYQIKRILNMFIETKRNMIIPVLALLAITTEFILQNYITYYVDLIAIPFILEILYIILNKEYDSFHNLLTLLCVGIIVALKVSNALLLIPMAIVYLIGARKTIRLSTVLIGIILVIFPVAIYLLNNYIQTRKSCIPIL